jgi:hypothetical protein
MILPTKCLAVATVVLIHGCSGSGSVTPPPPTIESPAVVQAPGSTYLIGDVQFDGPMNLVRMDIIKDGGSLGATLVDARGQELSVLHIWSMVVIRPGQPIPRRPTLPLRLMSTALPESPYYPPVGGADDVEVHRMIGDWIAEAGRTAQPASGGDSEYSRQDLAQRLQLARRLYTGLGNRLLPPASPQGKGDAPRIGLAN